MVPTLALLPRKNPTAECNQLLVPAYKTWVFVEISTMGRFCTEACKKETILETHSTGDSASQAGPRAASGPLGHVSCARSVVNKDQRARSLLTPCGTFAHCPNGHYHFLSLSICQTPAPKTGPVNTTHCIHSDLRARRVSTADGTHLALCTDVAQEGRSGRRGPRRSS